jgi:hypothetical protein
VHDETTTRKQHVSASRVKASGHLGVLVSYYRHVTGMRMYLSTSGYRTIGMSLASVSLMHTSDRESVEDGAEVPHSTL